MTKFLVFSLVAPMGACGYFAGYDRRPTETWPRKSAILGIVGAALGVRKDDSEGQRKLASWNVAVSVPQGSTAMFRDYHTVQTVPGKVKNPNSRPEALLKIGREVNTLVTQRDYLSDLFFGVALWPGNGGGDLEDLRKALEQPYYIPYFGRKSCPFSAPFGPEIVEVAHPVAALEAAVWPCWLEQPRLQCVYTDPVQQEFAGWMNVQEEIVWDSPIDRKKWHFAKRQVDKLVPVKDNLDT